MAAPSASNPYGALTLVVTPVQTGTVAALAANAVVIGFIDELNRARLYNPFASGFAPQTGDAANKWLPTVSSVTQITAPDGSGQIGEVFVQLTPGTSDVVNVASVGSVRVDPHAQFIVATGTF